MPGETDPTQNPNFADESLTHLSWVRVTRNVYPHARHAACCKRLCRVGDFVVSFPAITNGVLDGTALVHKQCLVAFLEQVPDEQTIVRSRWQEIREKHLVKSSTCSPK